MKITTVAGLRQAIKEVPWFRAGKNVKFQQVSKGSKTQLVLSDEFNRQMLKTVYYKDDRIVLNTIRYVSPNTDNVTVKTLNNCKDGSQSTIFYRDGIRFRKKVLSADGHYTLYKYNDKGLNPRQLGLRSSQ